MIRRWLHILLCAGAAMALSHGCAANSGAQPQSAVSVQYYYGPSPYFYDRHVVYYDAWGRPIYFVAGTWYRVPTHYRYYRRLPRDGRRYHYSEPHWRRYPRHPAPRAHREAPRRR
jgi:hypothetical protein